MIGRRASWEFSRLIVGHFHEAVEIERVVLGRVVGRWSLICLFFELVLVNVHCVLLLIVDYIVVIVYLVLVLLLLLLFSI